MMRRNKLLLGFLLLVLAPVVMVWYTAWPLLRPWHFPEIVSATLEKPVVRALTPMEVQSLNQWLFVHRTAWGTKGERPPGEADLRIMLQPRVLQNVLVLSVWHFRYGDDVVGIQLQRDGAYRMRSLENKEAHVFMKFIEEGKLRP